MTGLQSTFPPDISTNFPGDGFYPPAITKMEATGLSPLWLQDLALKILYFQGYLTGFTIAEEMALPFPNVNP
jgi:hypothetical protein